MEIATTERSGRVVALPENAQGVGEVLGLARSEGRCVVPWSLAAGGPDGLSGAVPLPESVLWLSTERIDGIQEVAAADLLAVAGAGATAGAVAAAAAEHGLFWTVADLVDPGVTVGDAIENAPGNWTLLGNLVRRSVLALEVVLADGEILRTGARTVKWVTGYDLRQLFTGSRGTLGIVTEATLRLDAIANREHLMRRYREDFANLGSVGAAGFGGAAGGAARRPRAAADDDGPDGPRDGSLVLLERLKREFDPGGVLAPISVVDGGR